MFTIHSGRDSSAKPTGDEGMAKAAASSFAIRLQTFPISSLGCREAKHMISVAFPLETLN